MYGTRCLAAVVSPPWPSTSITPHDSHMTQRIGVSRDSMILDAKIFGGHVIGFALCIV